MSDTFLSRWSRLKTQNQTAENAAPAPAPAESPTTDATPPVPDLPPIEELTAQSDFSAFLQAGVPEHLRRAALSKLWSSDPLFTQPEVFDLHMEDYNAAPLGEVVRTAWKIGQGIVDELPATTESASFPADQENSHTKTNQKQGDTADS